MKKKLTVLQSFNAMRNFLDDNYQKTKSDNVGAMLSFSLLFPDGGTFDPAIWNDWIESIEEVKGEKAKEVTDLEGFKITKSFLKLYYNLISKPVDIGRILKTLEVDSKNIPTNEEAWNLWLKCIKKALEDEGKPYKSPFV